MKRRDFLGLAARTALAAGFQCLWCKDALALDTFEREALFYTSAPETGGVVACTLCPHGCALPEGVAGLCGTRIARGGKLFTRVYGRLVAENCDPVEKKPLFHFLPGSRSYSIATAGCNMRCAFCQNWSISQAKPESLKGGFTSPEAVAARAAAVGAGSMAFTYTEPIVFSEYAIDVAKAAKDLGIPSVAVTAGYINQVPLKRLLDSLAAVKVDLKAFSDRFYREICNSSIEPVKKTILTIANSGKWLEIVCLLIPTLNDSPEELKKCARWLATEVGRDIPVHFTRFHPTYKLSNLPPTPVSNLMRAREIALAEGLRFVYVGNVPGSEAADTLCPGCGAKLITRHGFKVVINRVEPGSPGKCPSCGAVVPGVFSR